jgi:hypothetical protein
MHTNKFATEKISPEESAFEVLMASSMYLLSMFVILARGEIRRQTMETSMQALYIWQIRASASFTKSHAF